MSLLDDITPLLITLDEAPNIGRTLASLDWARDILVVDSGSTDGTLAMLANDSRIRVLERSFDSFASQCRFGLEQGGIRTEWVLSLDADHVLSPDLIQELARIEPTAETAGFRAAFTYCIAGRPLRASLYPPRIVLFRTDSGRYVDDGHGHRVEVAGKVEELSARILHDDRKSVARWLQEQDRYAEAEATKLLSSERSRLSMPDRVRRLVVAAPFLVFAYCLIIKRGILDGKAGLHYAFQRMVAEAVLSLRLLERKLGTKRGPRSPRGRRTP